MIVEGIFDMSEFENTGIKSFEAISKEWNNVAVQRYKQISEQKDLSYEYIIKPYILKSIKSLDKRKVIDLGCGTGNLTYEVSYSAEEMSGIDLSSKNIEIAKHHFKRENLNFINSSIEDFSANHVGDKFNLALSNMTLMDVNDLEMVLESIKSLLSKKGKFLFTITHPSFWPRYRGYENEEWFNYKKELHITSDFNIALEKNQNKTTHVHRPIEYYINSLIDKRFKLLKLEELVPPDSTLNLFPHSFNYPRFLGILVENEE